MAQQQWACTFVVGDGDLVLLAGALVHSRDVQDTVSVNIEGDLDLGYAPGCGRDARQLKLAEQVVVLGHGSLALKHLDEHTWLVVRVRGEGLRLLGGHGGVPLDEGGHDSAGRLNTQRERCHVQQEQVLDSLVLITGQDGRLHSYKTQAKRRE